MAAETMHADEVPTDASLVSAAGPRGRPSAAPGTSASLRPGRAGADEQGGKGCPDADECELGARTHGLSLLSRVAAGDAPGQWTLSQGIADNGRCDSRCKETHGFR